MTEEEILEELRVPEMKDPGILTASEVQTYMELMPRQLKQISRQQKDTMQALNRLENLLKQISKQLIHIAGRL